MAISEEKSLCISIADSKIARKYNQAVDKIILKEAEVKYLEVHVTNKLTWETHVQKNRMQFVI